LSHNDVYGAEVTVRLTGRRKIEVELPEFLIRSLQQRIAESNREARQDELVDLDDVIEWYLAGPITVADVTRFEAVIPGFADALSAWLKTVTYEPQ
jgi:hypothetical protein